MIIASYRNTERGMKNSPSDQDKSVSDAELRLSASDKFDRHVETIVAQTAPKRIRAITKFEQIVQRICRVFRVTMIDLRSPRRDERSVLARQAVFYWARRLTMMSLPQIGRLMGGRDHTTVLYGVSAYQKKRKSMGRHLRDFVRAAR